MTDVLIKRGNLDTDVHREGMQWKDEARDWGGAAEARE